MTWRRGWMIIGIAWVLIIIVQAIEMPAVTALVLSAIAVVLSLSAVAWAEWKYRTR